MIDRYNLQLSLSFIEKIKIISTPVPKTPSYIMKKYQSIEQITLEAHKVKNKQPGDVIEIGDRYAKLLHFEPDEWTKDAVYAEVMFERIVKEKVY